MMLRLSYKRKIRLINFYPPYIGAGIRMKDLAPDFTYCRVEMRLTWWNRNAVGVHFGGSLYAMTDPFYMLLLMGGLSAKEYIIWDKAAEIRFRRPGRTKVYANFSIPLSKMEEMRQEVRTAGGKKDFLFTTEVRSAADDTLIAEVQKTIYVRKK